MTEERAGIEKYTLSSHLPKKSEEALSISTSAPLDVFAGSSINV
jgi:hypothetical protein